MLLEEYRRIRYMLYGIKRDDDSGITIETTGNKRNKTKQHTLGGYNVTRAGPLRVGIAGAARVTSVVHRLYA